MTFVTSGMSLAGSRQRGEDNCSRRQRLWKNLGEADETYPIPTWEAEYSERPVVALEDLGLRTRWGYQCPLDPSPRASPEASLVTHLCEAWGEVVS